MPAEIRDLQRDADTFLLLRVEDLLLLLPDVHGVDEVVIVVDGDVANGDLVSDEALGRPRRPLARMPVVVPAVAHVLQVLDSVRLRGLPVLAIDLQ